MLWLVNKSSDFNQRWHYLKHILTASYNISDNKQYTDTKSQIEAFDSRIMQSIVDISDPEEGWVGMGLKT